MNTDTNARKGDTISLQRPLVFMHIPKTGGMSLFTALVDTFGARIADLYNISPRNSTFALKAFRDHSKAVYCGHYAFGVHEWFDRPVSYAAVVREPVARLVSLYHYCQPLLKPFKKHLENAGGDEQALWANLRLPDFYLDFPMAVRGDLSAEAFFSSPSAELDNGMVRRFSGWGLNPAPCPNEALGLAKTNIEQHFSLVGVLERYADTLQLMKRNFGLSTLAERKVNEGRGRNPEAISPAVLDRIRQMNALDLALYDWINARFDTALAQAPAVKPVGAGHREDAASIPLWRSVGQSPMREAATRNLGPSKHLELLSLENAGVHANFIQIPAVTRSQEAGTEPTLGRNTLVCAPRMAKALLRALDMAIEHYEKSHGPIEDR